VKNCRMKGLAITYSILAGHKFTPQFPQKWVIFIHGNILLDRVRLSRDLLVVTSKAWPFCPEAAI